MVLRTEETQRNRDREREDRRSKPIVSESSSVETKAAGSWVLEGGNTAMHLTSVIQQPSPQFLQYVRWPRLRLSQYTCLWQISK